MPVSLKPKVFSCGFCLFESSSAICYLYAWISDVIFFCTGTKKTLCELARILSENVNKALKARSLCVCFLRSLPGFLNRLTNTYIHNPIFVLNLNGAQIIIAGIAIELIVRTTTHRTALGPLHTNVRFVNETATLPP